MGGKAGAQHKLTTTKKDKDTKQICWLMISLSEGKNIYAILDLRRKIKLNSGEEKKKKKLNSAFL